MEDFPFEVVISAPIDNQTFPAQAGEWALEMFGYWIYSENRIDEKRKDIPLPADISIVNRAISFCAPILKIAGKIDIPIIYCSFYFKNEKDAALFKVFWS